jgi:hypothetical protein
MAAHTTLARDPDASDDAASGRSAGEDFLVYLGTLRVLDDQGAAVNSALLEAHTAHTAQRRRTALTARHSRLRDMAATANDALGSWPEPGDGPA